MIFLQISVVNVTNLIHQKTKPCVGTVTNKARNHKKRVENEVFQAKFKTKAEKKS